MMESRSVERRNSTPIRLNNGNFRHTQRGPLCLLVYGTAIMFLVLGWAWNIWGRSCVVLRCSELKE